MTVGVFHQVCYRPKATEEAIKSFRQFHPDTPYVLVCDGGKSFHRVAKRYASELTNTSKKNSKFLSKEVASHHLGQLVQPDA